MSSSWQIQLCIKYKLQLINNTVLSFKLILKVGSVHFKIWPCLRRINLACNAMHSLLIVLEHLHTKVDVMLCPFFNILHFIFFPCLVGILTLQKKERANSQKIICVSSCQKNLHILPLISISFVPDWGFYSLLGLAVLWLFSQPLEYWVKLSFFLMELVLLLR